MAENDDAAAAVELFFGTEADASIVYACALDSVEENRSYVVEGVPFWVDTLLVKYKVDGALSNGATVLKIDELRPGEDAPRRRNGKTHRLPPRKFFKSSTLACTVFEKLSERREGRIDLRVSFSGRSRSDACGCEDVAERECERRRFDYLLPPRPRERKKINVGAN